MASVIVSTLIFSFILLFACFSLPINGINLVKHNNTETRSQGEGEGITGTRRFGTKGSNSSAQPFISPFMTRTWRFGTKRSNPSAKTFISPFMGQQADMKILKASWATVQREWHGGNVEINVWGIPDVQPQSQSAAYITALNDQGTRKDLIAAGVHVCPSLYGNNDLHYFVYWTSDDGNSIGCFNTQCSGFVLADGSNLIPGDKVMPLSTYGEKEYYITLRIKKDEQTGDWSLYRADKGGPIGGAILVGWWPKTLFTGLANFATKIVFGRGVSYHVNETSPPMGSGHFPEEGEGKAAYLKNIIAYDNRGKDYRLFYADMTMYVDADECYKVSNWLGPRFPWQKSAHYFYYGGPSGCKA